MKYIFFLFFFLLIPLVFAEITFFDNPDNFFIMGDFNPTTTGEVINETIVETIIAGGCMYKWNCTNWGRCLISEKQNRNCTNIGTCSDKYNPPEIEQNCTYDAPEIKKEEKKQEGKTIWGEILDKNKIFVYFIIILIILFIVFYFKKKLFKNSI